MTVLWFITWRNSILLISFKTSTWVVSQAKQYSVAHEDSFIRFIITLNGQISHVFNFRGIWTCDNYHTVLTLCPFSPGSPGSPSKPLSPCIETQQRMSPDHTTSPHIQVKIMGCSMLVAMLYKNNTLILIFQRERLWHVYLATWLSGHSTGPISSGTALRNSSRKIIQIDKDLHIV